MKLIAVLACLVTLSGVSAQTESFGKDIKIEFPKGKDNFEYFSIADTNLSSYALPLNFTKPAKWKEIDQKRTQKVYLGYENKYPDTFEMKDAITILETETEFAAVCSAKKWCIDHYTLVFPYLISKLSDKRKIGLTNTADLIISGRITSGDMQFYGHGGMIDEDLFTVAGRASWILNELTGEEFAVVHGSLTKEEAEQMKILWKEYISSLE